MAGAPEGTTAADGGGPSSPEPPIRIRPLLCEVLQTALPNISAYLLGLANELTNTVFLGHTGDEAALAAVGFGNMMQNCFGLSVGFGMAAGLDTLVSQAYGARQHRLSCLYLQRCRVLVTLQLLWMAPLLWSSGRWLHWLHQDPEVVRGAGGYNRAAVWGLFAVFQFEANRKFLQNQGHAAVPAVICGVCSVLHVAWCAVFIGHFKLGNAGAGYANVVTWWLEFAASEVYLAFKARGMGIHLREVLWIQSGGLRGWGGYLRVALPATVQMCSEWWFWEISSLVVGYMGAVQLAAHVSTNNFVVLLLTPAIGLQVTAATLVGNALGANRPRRAQANAGVCVGLNVLVWCAIAAATVFGRSLLAEAYTSRDGVGSVMQRLLCISAVFGFCETCQNVMGGALRGLGKQQVAAAVYLVAYYGIMLPLGCVLGFPLGLGVYGIWDSFIVGTVIASVTFAAYLCRLDYASLAREASEKMEREGQAAKESQDLLGASLQDDEREVRA